jgi:hypothetical protein
MSGMLGSFSDAPGGGKEELQEVMLSIGAEYSYQNQFFARAGYFYESKYKGDRRFLTVGLGVKYNVFGLNILSNTLRFSLLFDIDDLSKLILPDGDKKKKDDKKDDRKEKK